MAEAPNDMELDEQGLEQDIEGQGEPERDTVSSEEERAAAAEMGWVDRPDFRGEGGVQWKTAKEFLEHGRDVLPVLRHNNKRLLSELESERRERMRLDSELRAQGAALRAIRDAQEEASVADAAARKAELQADLAEAVRSGEGERVAELTEQLIQLGQQMAKKPAAGEPPPQGGNGAQHPDISGFLAENPWYVADAAQVNSPGKDLRRTRMMNLVAAEMRQAGDSRVGRQFLDAVKAEVDKTLPVPPRNDRGRPNSVEGSRGGAGTGPSGGGKSGRYADLPPEAKAQCERDVKSLVGPTKRHKTADSYRAAYARIYFEGEQ